MASTHTRPRNYFFYHFDAPFTIVAATRAVSLITDLSPLTGRARCCNSFRTPDGGMCNSCFPIRRRSSVHPEFVQPTTKTIQTKNVYDCAEALNSNLEMIMRLRVLFGSVVVLG